MDFKAMRKEAGLTLAQAAQLSGYTIGAINGQELHDNGSDRLKQKLFEIYRHKTSTPALHDAPAESDLEIWKRRAKKAEQELHELKTKLRALLSSD